MSSGSDSSDRTASASSLRELIGLDETRRAERLAFFDLGPADAAALAELRRVAERDVDAVVGAFYAHLLRFPELARLLEAEPDRIERLKEIQRAHFLSLTDAQFDDDFFESRLRVGDAHQRLGVGPTWYIGAFSLYLRLALRSLLADRPEGADLLPAAEALVKSVFLDVSLAIETYIYGGFVNRAVADRMEQAVRVAEEALHARAEVERLKDELTSMVVHDLKNPVNGILMMVQLALRKGWDLPELHRGHLRQVERTCREMMRLIQNLLEIAKIEEGKMPVAHEAIVLAEVADEVAGEYDPVAAQAGRQLVVSVDVALPPAAGDRGLLKRVLVNLVVNAIRHSGSREVRIEAGPGPGADEVTIAVVDRGHGIVPEEQARIFEKYRTVHRSPADDPTSDTGLGLPFCKLATERMGGRIALTSTPTEETRFAVTLPVYGS
jgi:signal transduction histidine kinase